MARLLPTVVWIIGAAFAVGALLAGLVRYWA